MMFEQRTARLLRSAALATVSLAASPQSAAAQDAALCTGPFYFGRRDFVAIDGATRRDQICTINYGARSQIVGYRLVTRPRHGVIGAAGNQESRYRTAYRPNPGFVGSDMFEVMIDYIPFQGRQSRERVRLRVNMTVTP